MKNLILEKEKTIKDAILLLNKNPFWAAQVLVSGQKKITTYQETVKDKATGKETKVDKSIREENYDSSFNWDSETKKYFPLRKFLKEIFLDKITTKLSSDSL